MARRNNPVDKDDWLGMDWVGGDPVDEDQVDED